MEEKIPYNKVDLAIYIREKSKEKGIDYFLLGDRLIKDIRKKEGWIHSIELEDFYTVFHATKYFGYDEDLKERAFKTLPESIKNTIDWLTEELWRKNKNQTLISLWTEKEVT